MSTALLRLVVAAQNARSAGQREEGQTLVEYALILALVSIGTLVALGAITGKLNDVFTDVANAI